MPPPGFLLALLLTLAAVADRPVLAQAPAPPAAARPSLPAAEAERLLDLLRDEARRAALLRDLEALAGAARLPPAAAAAPAAEAAAAAEAPAPEAAPPPAPEPMRPSSVVGNVLGAVSERLADVTGRVVGGTRTLSDLPNIAAWASGATRDPVTRARLLDASWKLLLLLGLGLLAEGAARRALSPLRQRLGAPPAAPRGSTRRARRILARLGLDLLPVGAFALVAHGVIGAVRPLPTTELVLLLASNAYVSARVALALARALLAPRAPALRLARLEDGPSLYIFVWLRRVAVVLVAGWAVAEAALLFGVPWALYDVILRLVLLAASLLLVVVVLQNRQAVAAALRAPPLEPGEEAPGGSRLLLRALRDRLAEVWHLLAILYLLALWGVWALEVEDGFRRLLNGSLVTLAVLMGGKLLDLGLRAAADRLVAVPADLSARFPELEGRAEAYRPTIKVLVSAAVVVGSVLALLEAWGLPALGWFARGRPGARLLAALASVGLTLLVAVAVWEAANAAIRRRLARLARDGGAAARSARTRTLLPMARTALMVVIALFVALNVLSELGVNVAPLIAGAGVVGVAVGFGSQKLVQDVITGLFLLLEDAVAVGDTVTVGPLSGVVEQLSIRSIRLRALDGSVHIIPFSTVTSVTNQTRDFAFAVLDVNLSYGQDTDRAARVLREIGEAMRAEPRWAGVIRDGMDVMGVERLSDAGVMLRARIKTEPSARWAVLREVNRRVRERFEAEGLRIPSPWRVEPPAPEAG